MTTKGKIHVFADADLDGAASYLLLSWMLGSRVPYTISPSNQFRESFLEWQKINKLSDYEKIFILDIDTAEHIDIIDHPNVVIVDHHETHFPHKSKYTKALAVVEECTSTAKLLHKNFKQLLSQPLSDKRKYLVLLANDYDSYVFDLKETRCLNTLFWNYQGDRVAKFCDRFNDGFDHFTMEEENICDFYAKRYARVIEELAVFETTINTQGAERKFVATFATEFLNDVAQHILDKHKGEVALVINKKTNKVSFRRRKDSTYDVGKLAAKIAKGGGHSFSAGGILTEDVLTFSALFKPAKI